MPNLIAFGNALAVVNWSAISSGVTPVMSSLKSAVGNILKGYDFNEVAALTPQPHRTTAFQCGASAVRIVARAGHPTEGSACHDTTRQFAAADQAWSMGKAWKVNEHLFVIF